jgi:tRNA 5-methylaminomethyl-2-thiouridine biosynthesis bifunctional protein
MDSKTSTFNPIRWDAQGVPHSVEFRDKYFCTQNGYEENHYISTQGNNLQQRFSKLDPNYKGTFVIIETGFGTGLSFCCIWELWEQYAPLSWSLHFISSELYPLTVKDIDRALSVWPCLSKYRQALNAQYQPIPGGIQHLYFNDRQIHLKVFFTDVVDALKEIHRRGLAGAADAWLLNGFSPFANPRMWSPEVFKTMAPLSKQGTTLSTFTVAGTVRRGLEAEGFIVEKIPGYGTKKQMLKGLFCA